MPSSFKPFLGISILLLLGFIWGTGYSIARFAMTNGVSPLGYSLWQSLGPAIIISAIHLLTHKQSLKKEVTQYQFYFVCGLTGIMIPNTVMYYAAPHLPAGILAMTVNTVPIIAYPMALLGRLESFNWQRVIGIFFAFVGLMLIILPSASLPSSNLVPWVLMSLITPFSFAFCSIYIARFKPKESDTLSLTAGMLIFSTLFLIPLVALTKQFYFFHFPLTTPDWIVLLEIILSSIGYVLFFQLIKIAGPVYYSLVDTIVVLTGLFWGYLIFAEQLNIWTGCALLFIILALLIMTRQQKIVIKVNHD